MDEKKQTSDISIELHIENKTYFICEFSGEEFISRPFRFILSYFDNTTLSQNTHLLGKNAKIILNSVNHHRQIIGIVNDIKLTFCHHKNLYRWQLTIAPKISLLKNSFGPRVFINKTAKEIIDTLLKSCGYQNHNIKWHFTAKNKILPHVLQLLHETDFDFLQRFLTIEGVFYWSEEDDDHETIHLGQDNMFLSQHTSTLKYYPNLNLVFNDQNNIVITDLCVSSHDVTRDISVYDYQTHTHHQVFASNDHPHFQKKYFGINVFSDDEAQETASLFVCAENANSIRITAKSQEITLMPAKLYDLNLDHFDEQHNGAYILTSIQHHFQKDIDSNIDVTNIPYHQNLTFIPQHHSLCSIPKIFPEALPLFSAMIKTKSNSNNAAINSRGGYSLQYHFDRENHEISLGNIPRISHFNAVNSQDNLASGLHLPLTRDAEVIIAYIDNNPYKPVIVATVANKITENIVTSSNNFQHYFKTPTQQSLIFNDDAQKTIQISNPNNINFLRLSSQDDANKISIVTKKNDVLIKANQDLISSSQNNTNEICHKNRKILSENNFIQKSLANTFFESALNQQWFAKNMMTVNSNNLQIKQCSTLETSVLQNSFTYLYGSSYQLISKNGKIFHQCYGDITIQGLSKNLISFGENSNLINIQTDGNISIKNNAFDLQSNGTVKFKGKIKHFR